MRIAASVAAALTLGATFGVASADDHALIMQAILAKWEAASSEITSIDASFTRLQIDANRIGQTVTRGHGRFYWESPDRAAYLVDGEVHCAWNDGLVLVELDRGTYLSVTATQHDRAIERSAGYRQLSFFQRLSSIGVTIAATRLDDGLPLCTRIDADQVIENYELAWQSHDEGILVTAIPKHPHAFLDIDRVDLILDPHDLHVRALRVVTSLGQQTVHRFTSTVINDACPDRDALLAPDVKRIRGNSHRPNRKKGKRGRQEITVGQ